MTCCVYKDPMQTAQTLSFCPLVFFILIFVLTLPLFFITLQYDEQVFYLEELGPFLFPFLLGLATMITFKVLLLRMNKRSFLTAGLLAVVTAIIYSIIAIVYIIKQPIYDSTILAILCLIYGLVWIIVAAWVWDFANSACVTELEFRHGTGEIPMIPSPSPAATVIPEAYGEDEGAATCIAELATF